VLPLRLDGDALDDLAVLTADGASGTVSALATIQSILVVSNVNDSGAGSLRQAILDANSLPNPDTITFNIPGSGVHPILPLPPRPPLNGSVTLDATTQPGYAGSPVVEIDGSALPPTTHGLTLQVGDNVVRGLAIHGFQGSGILISGGGHNLV